MQTTSLPIQVSSSGQTQNLRANATLPNDGVNFGATLQIQVEQRQAEQRQQEQRQAQAQVQPQPQRQPNTPAPAAVPKPQAAARPAANEAKAPAREAAREAANAPAKNAANSANAADRAERPQESGAGDKTAAASGEPGDEAASLPDASVADAVVDMLALVASFNQVQQAASAAPAAGETTAAQPGTLFDVAKDKPGDGALPVVQAEDALQAAQTGQAEARPEPGTDLRALDQGKAAETARLPAESGDFASRLRDTVAQAAAREPAPALEALRGAATQASALQGAQATSSVPTDRLSARVGTPAWDTQVGQKVIWMVGGADQSATLELNPPDLGPVQVVLNVSNDMASVTFSSQQLEVRQALENALPRLREMMNDSGIALGNAQVNAGAEGRQGQDGNGSGRPGSGRGGHEGGDAAVAETAPRQRTSIVGGAGAVDIFA